MRDVSRVRCTKRVFLILLPLVFAGCAAPGIKTTESKGTMELTDPSIVRPVAISNVVVQLDRGEVIGHIEGGSVCVDQPGDLTWGDNGKVNIDTTELIDILRDELESAGWPVVGSTEDFFSGYDYSGAELVIVAKIADMEVNLCYPNSAFGDWKNGRGEMYVRTEWQVYSPDVRQAVVTFYSEGSSAIKWPSATISADLLTEAFAFSVRNLLSDISFLEAMSSPTQIAQLYDRARTR